jgi:tRNA uridine 5-carboxymethylaminomethyl modification enzyme
MGRLKTGTPPRLHRRSIDFSRFDEQRGDDEVVPFSFMSTEPPRNQVACHVLYTTPALHDLVRASIGSSPLYNGQISGIGPRYCPSLEDKIMRFPHRERHQIFLEPEGLDTPEVYVNGPVDEPAQNGTGRDRPCAARPRGCRDPPARLCGRVRFHSADGVAKNA